MKKIITICVGIFITASVFAQSPNKMSYQAVIRNSSNALVTNLAVGMRISLLQTSPNGTVVYSETQTPTTNANGLASIEIGAGTVVSGTFASIDWSKGPYFIKTETDPSGGTNYTITGTSQLLSVPYALHAKTADIVMGKITETDPLFSGSQAANITAAHITKLSNLSGINTGDQDLSRLATITSLNEKVDKVTGKGLSSEDYTTAEKTKLSGLSQADGSETKLTAGVNISLTGSGTASSPYIINANGADGSETKLTAGVNISLTGSGTASSPYIINANGGSAHYIGKQFGGGVIFHLWKDAQGVEHGLIVDLTDLSTQQAWSNINSTEIGATAKSNWNGLSNSNAIVAQSGHTNSAAQLCLNSTSGGQSDWYLPSVEELNMLRYNLYTVSRALSQINGATQIQLAIYCSSTEFNNTNAWGFGFDDGSPVYGSKAFSTHVRAIRAF
jgi:hypothetical protein